MTDKTQKLKYYLGIQAISFVLGVVAFMTVYSHLWLQKLANTPGSDVAIAFSEDLAAEEALMTDIRLAGLFLLAGLIISGEYVSFKYIELKDNPNWEIKKGMFGGIAILLVAGVALPFVNGLVLRSMAFAGSGFGLWLVLTNAVGLIYLDFESASETAHTRGDYCPNCGTAAADRGDFCPGCGKRV